MQRLHGTRRESETQPANKGEGKRQLHGTRRDSETVSNNGRKLKTRSYFMLEKDMRNCKQQSLTVRDMQNFYGISRDSETQKATMGESKRNAATP